jgi:hypothetical protein
MYEQCTSSCSSSSDMARCYQRCSDQFTSCLNSIQ